MVAVMDLAEFHGFPQSHLVSHHLELIQVLLTVLNTEGGCLLQFQLYHFSFASHCEKMKSRKSRKRDCVVRKGSEKVPKKLWKKVKGQKGPKSRRKRTCQFADVQ
jgi:hypothetical protein